MVDAAIGALSAIAGQLAWPQYEQLLNQWLKAMRMAPAKPTIRTVCCVLDAFHFPLPKDLPAPKDLLLQPPAAAKAAKAAPPATSEGDGNGEPAAASDKADAEGGDKEASSSDDEADSEDAGEEEEVDAASAAADDRASAVAQAAVIQTALLRRILPALHRMLVKDHEVVRAPVALALVKLLKLLPPEAERTELPRALQARPLCAAHIPHVVRFMPCMQVYLCISAAALICDLGEAKLQHIRYVRRLPVTRNRNARTVLWYSSQSVANLLKDQLQRIRDAQHPPMT